MPEEEGEVEWNLVCDEHETIILTSGELLDCLSAEILDDFTECEHAACATRVTDRVPEAYARD